MGGNKYVTADIDKSVIINKAVELANEIGFEKVTLKLLASNLNIKPPSLSRITI